mgnify:FL=1
MWRCPGMETTFEPIFSLNRTLNPDFPMDLSLTPRQVADFHRDGYVIARRFFNDEETDRL